MVVVSLLALGAVELAGCRVDQEKEVAVYRRVLDADAAERPNRLAADEPLGLERALRLANHDNERLNIEGENYLQAIIAKKRLLAEFLPTVTFGPAVVVRDPVSGAGGSGADRASTDVTAGGGYVDFNPVQNIQNVRGAGATVEQRRALLLDAKASLLIDVAQAFYQVLRSERQVGVLQNSLAVQEERVRDVEAQLDVGIGRPLDRAQAEAQAASTRVLVVQARGDVRNARSVLAFLIGAPGVGGALVDDFAVPNDIPTEADFRAAALGGRQDLAAARADVIAQRYGVDAAIAQHYPSVSLNLDYFVYRETAPAASLYTALLQANIPVFTAGRIHQDVRAAWSRFRQAKLDESLTRRRVLQDVEIAYQNLLTSDGRLKELRVQVGAAQEAFDQAADLVRAGRATNLERLIAQDQLLNAQLQLTSELFTRKVAYLNLRRASGILGLGVNRAATQPAASQP
jgi:outer membrane protein TolC